MLKRHDYNPGKRVIYAANATPEIILATIESLPIRIIPVFRGFIQDYLLFKPSFNVSFGDVGKLEYCTPAPNLIRD
ncbi:Cytochrome P450 [Macrophomina phaseolina MS6]|uniref:Cytochrome P450 n=1 Tax=Macrophomina phaseolina (strain MS6) TaxID=1126212 RepID=K2RN69_MACPH|nr:Cytochrome P450 [Macrophomina phaseolina MS6]